MVPLKFGIVWLYEGTVLVDVYAGDGSVAVAHGGVEVGQGINTKVFTCLYKPCIILSPSLSLSLSLSFSLFLSPFLLPLSLSSSSSLSLPPPPFQVAQVAAKTLGIPLDMVKVKPTSVLTNPNGYATGGSITTELNSIVSVLMHRSHLLNHCL